MAISPFRLAIVLVSALVMSAPGLSQARYDRTPEHRHFYGERYNGDPGWRDGRAAYHRRDDRSGRSDRCDRGTGGTIIGAIAGGLLGNTIAGRGDRTVGTVVGAGAGALAGRAIDRDC